MEASPLQQGRRALSDEPRLSSAALCTSLELLDTSFAPEYTHQCVDTEGFRGHRPLSSRVEKARRRLREEQGTSATEKDPPLPLHASHRNEDTASFELDLRIRLAPSCRSCQVKIYRTPVSPPKSQSHEPPASKKVKFSVDCPSTAEIDTPLMEEEIQNLIAKALPSRTTTELDTVANDYLHEPIGKIVSKYSRSDKSSEASMDFVVSIADGASAEPYHSKVQRLALWFIENADDVDVSSTEGGFWKVAYIFQKHPPEPKYSMVGFVTLFHFSAPFHKPIPGTIVRICQALVLPPYQGQGHGKRLVDCVYDYAHEKFDLDSAGTPLPIVQVNVEDPAPGFVALRNKVDLALLSSHPEWWPATAADVMTHADNDMRPSFVGLTTSEAQDVSAVSKLTPRQVQFVHEALTLRRLHQLVEHEKGGDDEQEDLEKSFRLMVKKRLNREHKEEMGAYPTKDEKKAFLAKLFDEEYARLSVLCKTKR